MGESNENKVVLNNNSNSNNRPSTAPSKKGRGNTINFNLFAQNSKENTEKYYKNPIIDGYSNNNYPPRENFLRKSKKNIF